MRVEGVPSIHGVEIDWSRVDSLFSLDPKVIYLNHGGFGAVPIPVQRAQQRLRDEMDANPTAFYTRSLVDRITHTRRHLAAFLGADPELTALVPNVTAAAQTVLRTLGIGQGDEVLVTDHGYGSTTLALQHLGAAITVVNIPLGATDDECVALLSAAARPGVTRLAVVDHVTSPTARLFPVARIAAAMREREIPLYVDGAHVPGHLPVDVSAIGADFWAGNLHKWAFAPRPTALLAVAARHRARVAPSAVSWEDASGFPTAIEYGGTLDYSAWLAAPAGLHLLRTLGVERVRRHGIDVATYGQGVLANALGTTAPAGSDGVCMRLVPLPRGTAEDPAAALALRARIAAELRCEVAVPSWGGRGYLRVSGAAYNRPEHYDRLAAALPALIR